MRKLNSDGLNLIKSFEGLYLTAYLDIVGVPTIGYGCTEGVTKADVQNKRTITPQQAEDMLRAELDKFCPGVEKAVKVPLNDNQFAALVSFSYNLGLGSLQKSTLLKLLNSGDYTGASNEFPKWNKAGGKEVSGLTRRRNAERDLFLKSAGTIQSNSLLPDGPSDDEIRKKLEAAEGK